MRKDANRAIETHDICQRRFPVPGSELGETTAIPYAGAYDVDMSGGRQSEYCLGRGDNRSNMSRIVEGQEEALNPAKNPTRYCPQQPEWMQEAASTVPSSTRRKRK